MIYLANAFSLQMLDADSCTVRVETLAPEAVSAALNQGEPWQSVVGHADTAAVFSAALAEDVAHNRANVTLRPGDVLLVGQITGGRLPEGATTLPEGVRIVWRRVEMEVAYEVM